MFVRRPAAGLLERPTVVRHALVPLKSSIDFERVRRDGRSHAHPLVVLLTRRRAPDEAAPGGALVGPAVTRVGFVAGKSVGSAVRRNRAKRLLREALRACAPALGAGWDLVLIARRPLAASRLTEAKAALEPLLRRAKVLVHET